MVRKGEEADVSDLLKLIQELAIFENEPDQVDVTEEILKEDGFGPNKVFDFFVAEDAGNIIGIALYYVKYSTWKGRCIHLEDLIVSEKYRGQKVGQKLFQAVAEVAKEQKVMRMEWQVLDWNATAIQFYKKFNTSFDEEWINCKLGLRATAKAVI